MENVRNESDALKACSTVFVQRASEEFGLDVHHVDADSRKKSCMCVETQNGRSKQVPVLGVYFRDASFQKVVDDRGRLTPELSEQLRKLWQEITIPYGVYLNRKDYCDSRMYVNAFNFEQRCFYDYVSNRQSEISDLLYRRLGVRPERIYPSPECVSIVYSTADFMSLRLEARAESLQEEIFALADRYMTEKYHEKIKKATYIRFLHPGMPGYNAYGLWL